MKILFIRMLIFFSIFLLSCTKNEKTKKEIWIYTSLYKDTIADMTPRIAAAFPDVEVFWYQAGSEDIAAKVNTEMMAGIPKVDLLISSERLWYQELSDQGKLHSFKPAKFLEFYEDLQNPLGTFHVASIPVMVIAYNSEGLSESDVPKTFLAFSDPIYKNKISGGSPLSSGTNFTTVAALQHKYGWEYFTNLKKNNVLFEGGNSAVVRRIQNKERPIGWVLLENILRFQKDDPRLKVIYPEDGAVTQFNTLAIVKKDSSREIVEKISDWIFSEEGQSAMTRSYMYSVLKNFPAPIGALDYLKLKEKSFSWNQTLLQELTAKRGEVKEKFSSIILK